MQRTRRHACIVEDRGCCGRRRKIRCIVPLLQRPACRHATLFRSTGDLRADSPRENLVSFATQVVVDSWEGAQVVLREDDARFEGVALRRRSITDPGDEAAGSGLRRGAWRRQVVDGSRT